MSSTSSNRNLILAALAGAVAMALLLLAAFAGYWFARSVSPPSGASASTASGSASGAALNTTPMSMSGKTPTIYHDPESPAEQASTEPANSEQANSAQAEPIENTTVPNGIAAASTDSAVATATDPNAPLPELAQQIAPISFAQAAEELDRHRDEQARLTQQKINLKQQLQDSAQLAELKAKQIELLEKQLAAMP